MKMTNDVMDPRLKPYIIDEAKYEANHTATIMLDDTAENHVYQSGQARYHSVTTILDAISYNRFLMKWSNNLGFRHIKYQDELAKSAAIGTAVHSNAQALVDPQNGKVAHVADPLQDHYIRKRTNTLRTRLDLEKRKCPWYTIFTEKTFISHKYQIAGTIDWFVRFYGQPTIADFKSSSGMREKHIFQLGGYSLLMDDNGIEWERAMIILCKEDNAIIHMYPKKVIQDAAKYFLLVKDYGAAHNLITDIINDRQYVLESGPMEILPETTT